MVPGVLRGEVLDPQVLHRLQGAVEVYGEGDLRRLLRRECERQPGLRERELVPQELPEEPSLPEVL